MMLLLLTKTLKMVIDWNWPQRGFGKMHHRSISKHCWLLCGGAKVKTRGGGGGGKFHFQFCECMEKTECASFYISSVDLRP